MHPLQLFEGAGLYYGHIKPRKKLYLTEAHKRNLPEYTYIRVLLSPRFLIYRSGGRVYYVRRMADEEFYNEHKEEVEYGVGM